MDINGGLNWKSPELFFVLRNQIRIEIFSIVSIKSWYCKSSRWWSSGKNLRSRGLLSLWSQVRALWLLIWWSLEVYMVVNFRTHGISRGVRKLTRTPTLKKKRSWYYVWESYLRFAQINFHRSNSSIVSSLYYTKLTRNHMVEVNRDPKKIGF
jgi:hypothetical protein